MHYFTKFANFFINNCKFDIKLKLGKNSLRLQVFAIFLVTNKSVREKVYITVEKRVPVAHLVG